MAVDIDLDDMTSEYAAMGHNLAVWGQTHATANEAFARAKFAREQVWARKRMEIRETQEAAGKKLTEGSLDALIVVDPDYEEVKFAEIEAEAEVGRLRAAVDALRAKKDMLVSIGATQRAEMAAQ
jgi:hypothetical protein